MRSIGRHTMADRTALYDAHRAAGARFIEFGGWEMPLQFTGIVGEHLAVRSSVGVFDVSHMGKLLVEGREAHGFLDGHSANAIPAKAGRARYTHLLREDGTILDDVIATCLDPDRYLVVCNAGPRPAIVAWLAARRRGDVRVTDLTGAVLCLALQGPRAPELLQRFTSSDVIAMRSFDAAVIRFGPPAEGVRRPGAAPAPAPAVPQEIKGWGSTRMADPRAEPGVSTGDTTGEVPLLVTRTGYTGEPGFELFPHEGEGPWVWESLLAEGADLGIQRIGLGARDTLRLEKGYLLAGQDFDGRQTPLEVNSEWVVKWDRPFVGREALEAQRSRGDYPRLVGLRMEGRGIPRHGHAVHGERGPVGTVTSGTLSPSLRVGIALASLAPFHGDVGTRVRIEIRGGLLAAEVVRLPFL